MIKSDVHRFVFIHIPKNAGTSVRESLTAVPDYDPASYGISVHPAMGRVHYAHLTLKDYRDHFPETLRDIIDYDSVAVIREPEDRFTSAIFQRLREFKHIGLAEMTDKIVEREIATVIDYLQSSPDRIALEFVHFTPQIDYVSLDGATIIKNLFLLEDFASLADFIFRKTGIAIAPSKHANSSATLQYPSLRPLVSALTGPYKKIVPLGVREDIRQALIRKGVFKSGTASLYERSFRKFRKDIEDFYAQDYALYARVKAASV